MKHFTWLQKEVVGAAKHQQLQGKAGKASVDKDSYCLYEGYLAAKGVNLVKNQYVLIFTEKVEHGLRCFLLGSLNNQRNHITYEVIYLLPLESSLYARF